MTTSDASVKPNRVVKYLISIWQQLLCVMQSNWTGFYSFTLQTFIELDMYFS